MMSATGHSHSFSLDSISGLLPRWEQEMQIADATKRAYRRSAEICLAWLQEQGAPALDADAIEAWTQNIAASGLQRGTAKRYRAGVRSLLAWLEAEGGALLSAGAPLEPSGQALLPQKKSRRLPKRRRRPPARLLRRNA